MSVPEAVDLGSFPPEGSAARTARGRGHHGARAAPPRPAALTRALGPGGEGDTRAGELPPPGGQPDDPGEAGIGASKELGLTRSTGETIKSPTIPARAIPSWPQPAPPGPASAPSAARSASTPVRGSDRAARSALAGVESSTTSVGRRPPRSELLHLPPGRLPTPLGNCEARSASRRPSDTAPRRRARRLARRPGSSGVTR